MARSAWLVCPLMVLAGCSRSPAPEPVLPPQPASVAASVPDNPLKADEAPRSSERPTPNDSLQIRFERLTPMEGLTVSVTATGDGDGETVFANRSCCGIGEVRSFVADVSAKSVRGPLTVRTTRRGWSVRHAPNESVTITYRLPPSGATTIDSGIRDQVRPIVHDGVFHLIGDTALLLPTGRPESDHVAIDIEAPAVPDKDQFASSFGPGAIHGEVVLRSQILRALYLGGQIGLDVQATPAGRVGIAYSAMAPTFREAEMRNDVLAILDVERRFFQDSQPWYLVSVRGGGRVHPRFNLGGGMGLTNSFAMFAHSDLDMSSAEHREQFRWVLAHEYFHEWNGITLRVAPLPGTSRDDAATYWFSEGVTEFYTMRLLTRAGLQTPERSLSLLNTKLSRYKSNSKRYLGANEAGAQFWKSKEGEQIPYLRGYLAAWFIDRAHARANPGSKGLDSLMLDLVERAKSDKEFRIDNEFLTTYLSQGLVASDAGGFRAFILKGGEAPLTAEMFEPCLEDAGRSESTGLQLRLAAQSPAACFMH